LSSSDSSTLSLHDALPIFSRASSISDERVAASPGLKVSSSSRTNNIAASKSATCGNACKILLTNLSTWGLGTGAPCCVAWKISGCIPHIPLGNQTEQSRTAQTAHWLHRELGVWRG